MVMRRPGILLVATFICLAGCELLETPGEDEETLMDWACANSVGWLLAQSPSDRIHFASTATGMWVEANQKPPDENWSATLATTEDLIGWYESGNEVAVEAFVGVNDCFSRIGEDER